MAQALEFGCLLGVAMASHRRHGWNSGRRRVAWLIAPLGPKVPPSVSGVDPKDRFNKFNAWALGEKPSIHSLRCRLRDQLQPKYPVRRLQPCWEEVPESLPRHRHALSPWARPFGTEGVAFQVDHRYLYFTLGLSNMMNMDWCGKQN